MAVIELLIPFYIKGVELAQEQNFFWSDKAAARPNPQKFSTALSLWALELAAAIYRYNWAETAFFQHTPKIHVAFMFGTRRDILFFIFIYMMII